MERVVKRFLMHNQTDADDPKQNEYDSFKQELSTIRYEMMNDMKKSRKENLLSIVTTVFLVFISLLYLNHN